MTKWFLIKFHNFYSGDRRRIPYFNGTGPTAREVSSDPAIGRLLAPGSTINGSLCILSILNRDWLLTTGKCGLSQGDLIMVGDEIFNETEPFEQVVKVERVVVHHRHVNLKYVRFGHHGFDS